jgi:Na+-transporting NADH:ubiquinone oxidoreductase subunit A
LRSNFYKKYSMSQTIKIRKGLDINLVGAAEQVIVDAPKSSQYAVMPTDFHGLAPKLTVKIGDSVKAGTSLFIDKANPNVNFVSPVSGVVADIVRGEKRKLLQIIIKADDQIQYESLNNSGVENFNDVQTKEFLMKNGLWSFIKMRPLDVMANPNDTPKHIFVSGYDSHPLATDLDFALRGKEKEFEAGIALLSKLTKGKVNLQLKSGLANSSFKGVKNVQINTISGPHPIGNVGVQIHHISPINKGEVVWVINALDVAIIGTAVLHGKYDATRLLPVTGAKATNRKYFRTIIGASINTLTNGNVEKEGTRVVMGNPLTGVKAEENDYLSHFVTSITALPEGNQYKFFLTEGWLSLGFKKFSMSRAYPTWLMPKSKKWNLDTNLNGEERSFVVTGQYEKVFPFDILPVHLVKAAITDDIDSMEKLGIYEVAPEDFALCEFVCTSKIEVQKVMRKGLDLIKSECF